MPPRRPAPPQDDLFLAYPGSALVVALLADKWTIPAIHALALGTRRTGELRAALAGVSQKMLTQTLRALEAHGLVTRTVYPVVPPARADDRAADVPRRPGSRPARLTGRTPVTLSYEATEPYPVGGR